jgi:hypothetical protein
MKTKNFPANVNDRRLGVLYRLKESLKTATEEKAIEVQEQIKILESKVTTRDVALSRKTKKYRGPAKY